MVVPDVSIIIPIHDGSQWIDDCFRAILTQTVIGTLNLEVSVYNDSSTDDSARILGRWQSEFKEYLGVSILISHGEGPCKGVGFAKNQAVNQSNGRFLCFQDVDDIMLPNRIALQISAAKANPNAIIGSKFLRDPPESTPRFSRWACNLLQDQLSVQVYTSHGPTVIMPTWFCDRLVFEKVGGFSELGAGTPEDLLFFYKHLDLGGTICRVDEVLLIYRYHKDATTFSIHENTIWELRVQRLQDKVLKSWPHFTIWNAGKQGRKLYRSLRPEFQQNVVALCDVDLKKIGNSYQQYFPENPEGSRQSHLIPIVSFKDATPPFVICVKLDFTAGAFEKNLTSLGLVEGFDYVIFS